MEEAEFERMDADYLEDTVNRHLEQVRRSVRITHMKMEVCL